MSRKQKIIVGVVVLGLVLILISQLFHPKPYIPPVSKMVVPSDPREEWRDFHPRSGLFSIRLPIVPQHASEIATMPATNERLHYDIYLAQMISGTTFLINVIQYPSTVDTAHPEALITNAIKDMQTNNPANMLIGTENGTFQNCPYTDYTISSPEAVISGRVLMYKNSLYIVSVADRDPDVAKTMFRKVIGSFQLPSN